MTEKSKRKNVTLYAPTRRKADLPMGRTRTRSSIQNPSSLKIRANAPAPLPTPMVETTAPSLPWPRWPLRAHILGGARELAAQRAHLQHALAHRRPLTGANTGGWPTIARAQSPHATGLGILLLESAHFSWMKELSSTWLCLCNDIAGAHGEGAGCLIGSFGVSSEEGCHGGSGVV